MRREKIKELVSRVLWYGGSTFDAGLNIAAAKIPVIFLNALSQATAQMGLPSAIFMQISQVIIGIWTQSIINILYLKYKSNTQNQISSKHIIQLHEVIGGHLGKQWRKISLFSSLVLLTCGSAQEILSSTNLVYVINNKLNKRTWTAIFGAIFSMSMLIPSAQNYRMWSFTSVITAVFASSYVTIAALVHGKVPNVQYTSPHSYQEYFTGLSRLIHFGHVVIPVEIMHAMKKPQEYKMAYFYAGGIFTLLNFMFPAISMYINFGDELLHRPDTVTLLPQSKFRNATVVLLLIHTFVNFGMYSVPVYTIWEKIVGVHESHSYTKRTLSRIPVFLAFWLIALAFPFLQLINRVLNTTLMVWNLYIIPCIAYIVVFWSYEERKRSSCLSRLGWEVDLSANLAIILWVLIVECGLATWADMDGLLKLKVKLFESCYNC